MKDNQLDLPVIPHQMDGNLINQRASDGYINATAMCQAAGKLWGHYYELKRNQEFIDELSKETKIPAALLVQAIKGGNREHQGTWVHPQISIHLAQWLSPRFAVQVSKWVVEWLSGSVTTAGTAPLPVHITRYLANRTEIPSTHFSMLNEITFALIAPLETAGYTLPEKMVPDISHGKMFSKWLRDEKNIDPSTFPTYKHRYTDGRVVDARLYPNELLADFRAHFHGVWLPKRATAYFQERDPVALQHLPKLLASDK